MKERRGNQHRTGSYRCRHSEVALYGPAV